MDFGGMLSNFFQWAFDLITGIIPLFEWLITPLPALSALIGAEVIPLYLIGVGGLTIGILRAIL